MSEGDRSEQANKIGGQWSAIGWIKTTHSPDITSIVVAAIKIAKGTKRAGGMDVSCGAGGAMQRWTH